MSAAVDAPQIYYARRSIEEPYTVPLTGYQTGSTLNGSHLAFRNSLRRSYRRSGLNQRCATRAEFSVNPGQGILLWPQMFNSLRHCDEASAENLILTALSWHGVQGHLHPHPLATQCSHFASPTQCSRCNGAGKEGRVPPKTRKPLTFLLGSASPSTSNLCAVCSMKDTFYSTRGEQPVVLGNTSPAQPLHSTHAPELRHAAFS